MRPVNYKKLDNPAWYALTEKHACFAVGTGQCKRYDPGIVLFAGLEPGAIGIFSQLDAVFDLNDSFFLFDEFPSLPENYQTEVLVECLQMICKKPVHTNISEEIVQLEETNTEEMFALVSAVFPGYYLLHTNRLGHYFGIFKDGRLVAMAGERLCMDGLTEVSAVVTHPAYTGRGYAQQLLTHIHKKHLEEGNVSFLHTGASNERAIKIYELLGYEKRRIMPVTKIKRIS
jgi:ribosomal protein S18 acetylase RimI-like enzyme